MRRVARRGFRRKRMHTVTIRNDPPENNGAYRSFQHSGGASPRQKAGIRVTRGREEGQPQERQRKRSEGQAGRLPHELVFRLRANFATSRTFCNRSPALFVPHLDRSSQRTNCCVTAFFRRCCALPSTCSRPRLLPRLSAPPLCQALGFSRRSVWQTLDVEGRVPIVPTCHLHANGNLFGV